MEQVLSNKIGKRGKKKVSFNELADDLNNGNNYKSDEIQPRSNNESAISYKETSSQSSGIRHTRKHPTIPISSKLL